MNIRRIIKEELLNEVGGYDDPTIMGTHAGATMGQLSGSYNKLMNVITDLANLLISEDNPGGDKFKASKEIMEVLDGVINETIDVTKKALADFTEDDVLMMGKNYIKDLKTFLKRARLISGLISTYTPKQYTEELKKLLMDVLPKMKEYGDTLIKSSQMFQSRMSSFGFN